MGQQSLIYSFVARGTVVLAEYTEFTGNFPTVAAQCLQKLPASNNKFTYNCDGHTFKFVVADGFTQESNIGKMKRRGAKKSRKGKKKARVEADAMDVELWKDFPEELVEDVIGRLPILTILRIRLVCRNFLPKSPHFQQLRPNFAPQKYPLFSAVAELGHGDGEIGALYDPSTKEWCYTKKVPPPASCYWGIYAGAASAGGLVCYYDRCAALFCVGNFLTQTWKKFPWLTVPSPIIGMVTLKSGTAAYKIIWVDGHRKYRVYDSMKDSTSSTSSPISKGTIPANIKLSDLGVYGRRAVSIGTAVYFMTRKPDGIISYDVVSGAWEQFLIPSPHVSNFFTFIAECGGRLVLVTPTNNPCSVCVWELETAMLCWKEVDRMPSSWCSQFHNDDFFLADCVGNGRVLVMLLQTLPPRRTRIVTYDVVNREWSKPPRFAIPGRYPRIMCGVTFLPCFSASP